MNEPSAVNSGPAEAGATIRIAQPETRAIAPEIGHQPIARAHHDPPADHAGQRPTDRHRAENDAAGHRGQTHARPARKREEMTQIPVIMAPAAQAAKRTDHDDPAVPPEFQRQHRLRVVRSCKHSSTPTDRTDRQHGAEHDRRQTDRPAPVPGSDCPTVTSVSNAPIQSIERRRGSPVSCRNTPTITTAISRDRHADPEYRSTRTRARSGTRPEKARRRRRRRTRWRPGPEHGRARTACRCRPVSWR